MDLGGIFVYGFGRDITENEFDSWPNRVRIMLKFIMLGYNESRYKIRAMKKIME